MSWTLIADWVGMTFMFIGAAFTLIAAIGSFRYHDLLSRQHVATKPQVFSLMMLLIGVMLIVRDTAMTWTLLVVIAFQLITSPISAHVMSRAGYRTGRVITDNFFVDELTADSRNANTSSADQHVHAEAKKDTKGKKVKKVKSDD